MVSKFKIQITVTILIIWAVLHLFYNSFKNTAILEIILIYGIAFVFPFFEVKANSAMEIPVLIFFLFNISVLGKAVNKLGFFFDKNNIAAEWITKSLVVLIYAIILAVSNKGNLIGRGYSGGKKRWDTAYAPARAYEAAASLQACGT